MRELPEVWERYHAGDLKARDELVAEYLPLTRYIAGQMSHRLPPSVSFDDLVSYGSVGLLDAIEKFDPGRGVRFGAYAAMRVRGAVLDELRALDWLPRSARSKARAAEMVADKLGGELGRAPTDAEVATTLGMSEQELALVLADAAMGGVGRLDDHLDLDRGVVGATEWSHAENPADTYFGSGLVASEVASVVSRLPERQRMILALYCVEELTLSEIGEVFGVTESRVCQLHTQTVAALQEELQSRGAGYA